MSMENKGAGGGILPGSYLSGWHGMALDMNVLLFCCQQQ